MNRITLWPKKYMFWLISVGFNGILCIVYGLLLKNAQPSQHESALGDILVVFAFLFQILFLFHFGAGFARTITLCAEGCQIQYLCFKKQYSWEQMHAKAFDELTPDICGIVFSGRPIRRKYFDMYSHHPNNYILFRPLSCFYIKFTPETLLTPESSQNPSDPVVISIRRSDFAKTLKDWNVELDALPETKKE